MKEPRYRTENSQNCANLIWRELIVSDRHASVLTKRGLDIGPQSVFASNEREDARPSDWFLLYAISQTLVQPELSGSRFKLRNVRRAQFRQDVVDAAIRYKSDIQKTALSLVLNPNPKRTEMKRLQDTLAEDGEVIRAAVTDVVQAWRRDQGGSERQVQLFGREDCCGIDAISNLRAAMIAGLTPATGPYANLDKDLDRQGWLEAPSSFGGESFRFVRGQDDPRDKALDAISSAAFDSASPYHLINAHAPGLRGGLTALAAELFTPRHRAGKHCRLPLLYLPLHGRTIEPPKDSFAALAHEIWLFYHAIHRRRRPRRRSDAGAGLDRSYEMPRSLDQTIELLQAIHQLMAEYPAIIIFDGYRTGHYNPDTRDYSLPNLTAAIAGDRLFDLIERLVMIPTPGHEGPIDTVRFCSNRFIILSDLPIYSDDVIDEHAQSLHPHPATRLINGISIPVPAPKRDLLPDILGSFGNQQPDQIGWIRSVIGGRQGVDRTALQASFEAHTARLLEITEHGPIRQMAVSESLVGVLSTMVMLGIRIPNRLKASRPGAAVRELIEEALWPVLAAKKPGFEAVMLHLIAIAPGGLRPKTLARVYEHYLDTIHGGESPISRREINKRIETLLIKCHGLVSVLRSDALDALSGRPVPLLFRRGFGFSDNEIDCDRAIEFNFDEVRDIVLRQPFLRFPGPDRHTPGDVDPAYFPFLHLLLAEEAYEQFTHLARYDHLQSEESLHRRSRLLAAIYHGAASIGHGSFNIAPVFSGGAQFLPANPRDRWIKLYSFAYRRNLDHPPQHDLVRRFDAAQTKLDILLALARPQLCLATEPLPAKWPLPRLAEGPAATSKARRRAILREFAFDLRGAGNAVSRQLDVDWPAAEAPNEDEPGREPRSNQDRERLVVLTEMALTLTDEPHVRDEEVDRVSGLVMAEMVRLIGGGDVDDNPVRAHLKYVDRHIDRILRSAGRADFIPPSLELRVFDKAAIPTGKVKPLIDYLSLYGEILGVRADRDYGVQLAEERTEPTKDVLTGFVESFSAFYVAEFLRNRIFWENPNHGRDAIGGRAARGFVRVSLKLERFRITLARHHEENPEPGGWFWQHAHRVSDEFARNLSHYPRERVANLILDATMVRYYESKYGNPNRYAHFLMMARECLRSAEPLVLKLSMHNRLRQRFALERTKVLAESARLAIDGGQWDQARRFLAICESDIDSFERIARPEDQLWENLGSSNRARVKKLKAKLTDMQRQSA